MPKIEMVEIDADRVRQALAVEYGSMSAAASALSISRTTLHKWLRERVCPDEALYAMRGRGLPAEIIWPDMPPMDRQ